ncbi:MAG: hypothetical protein JST40_04595 [Armatimonadetes bacterium]|nr:hypothetical protein [Armatimonadota bacterium]
MKCSSTRSGVWSLTITKLLVLMMLFCTFSIASAQSGGVRGVVYEDVDFSGHHEEGEPGFSDALMVLTGSGGTFTARTDQGGRYSFPDIPVGTYELIPPVTSGTEVTFPAGSIQHVSYNGGWVNAEDTGIGKRCIKITTLSLLCIADHSGCYEWKFTYTNNSSFPVSHIIFNPPTGVVFQSNLTAIPNYIPVSPALAPGASQNFTIKICGAAPNQQLCFEVMQHDATLMECCMSRECLDIPPCDCFQITEQTLECDAAGNITWCFTIQSLQNVTVNYLTLAPPPGVTFSQVLVPLNPPTGLAYGQTQQVCITISGATTGSQLCFWMGLSDKFLKACCSRYICLDLPTCGCDLTPGECCALKPFYDDQHWQPFVPNTVAGVTCWTNVDSNPVLALQNLDTYQCTPPPLGTNWAPVPLGYHGPNDSWNLKTLGTIFGLTFDKFGNIYVTHTSCFNGDAVGIGGPGAVYRIANGSGAVSVFATLPNNAITGASTEKYPALGNITYDCDHDQFFVTNHEDGKIYRLEGMSSSHSQAPGTVLSTYDPFNPDPQVGGQSANGFAPLGERLWGIQWHHGRVYFGRWSEDSTRPSATASNEVWSVGLLAAGGDFIAGTDNLEITVAPWTSNFSNPVSDISFSPEGKIMLAEHGMSGDTSTVPHQARGLEYDCKDGKWQNVGGPNQFQIGMIGLTQPSSAGGVDYDYSTLNCGPGTGRRVWFTGDFLPPGPGFTSAAYGIQGLDITGGTAATSVIEDVNGIGDYAKTTIGDVEIPCPGDAGALSASIQLGDWLGSPEGKVMEVEVRNHDTGAVVQAYETSLDAQSRFTLNLGSQLPAGNYDIAVKGKCWLRKKVQNVPITQQGAQVSLSLINGDVDGDNAVTVFDYLLLTQAFDSNAGESNYMPTADLDGDGSVSIFDYLILATNFDQFGDQ